eukprot:8212605-Pyramimonas_sp.AAC.2
MMMKLTWAVLGLPLPREAVLGVPWGSLEPSCGPLTPAWGCLGPSWGPRGRKAGVWVRLGAVLGRPLAF